MKLELVENRFRKGIQDGVPIGLGYLSVSFTFGMMAVSNGIPVEAAVVISLTNVTSAGQFSGLTLMLAHGSYVELALSQFIINLRYALMSLSLTQKVDRHMKTHERALIAYGVTDEIFALASSTYERVGKWYMAGLIAFPVFCWTLGTFLGGSGEYAASGSNPVCPWYRHLWNVPCHYHTSGQKAALRAYRIAFICDSKLSVCRYAGSCTCQLRVRHHYLYNRRICVWVMVLSGGGGAA